MEDMLDKSGTLTTLATRLVWTSTQGSPTNRACVGDFSVETPTMYCQVNKTNNGSSNGPACVRYLTKTTSPH